MHINIVIYFFSFCYQEKKTNFLSEKFMHLNSAIIFFVVYYYELSIQFSNYLFIIKMKIVLNKYLPNGNYTRMFQQDFFFMCNINKCIVGKCLYREQRSATDGCPSSKYIQFAT